MAVMAQVPEYLPLLHEAPTQQSQVEEKFSVNLLLLRRLITICKTISVPRTSLIVPFLLLAILMVQTYVVSLTGDGLYYVVVGVVVTFGSDWRVLYGHNHARQSTVWTYMCNCNIDHWCKRCIHFYNYPTSMVS